MSMETVEQGSVNVVQLTGRLDAALAPEVRRQVEEMIQNGRNRFLFDLEDVSFVDSSGLAVFVNALQNARAAGGDVALLKPQPPVQSILQLTRLQNIIQVYSSSDEAVSHLSLGKPS